MFLKIEHLYKAYSSNEFVLNDICLDIAQNERICVIGPSGCGKSTLLNLIAGLEKPTLGTIKLDNKIIEGPGADRAVMFQEFALFPWLTVIENVKLGLKFAGKFQSERHELACKYLEMVQLSKYLNHYPHELSGGMKQRVALARALALDSKILLMDEPFASVDNQTKNILQGEMLKIFMLSSKTIIMVTHNVEEAIFFADRIIMLGAKSGTIINEYNVNFPYPRCTDEPDLVYMRAKILSEYKEKGENR